MSCLCVQPLTTVEQIDSVERDWERLAGDIVFRQWSWLRPWCQAYGVTGTGGQTRPLVLAVRDRRQRIAGLVPWYIKSSRWGGREIHFLGSGEVCSDYLTFLARHEDLSAVTRSVANWLASAAAPGADGGQARLAWNLIDLAGVLASDPAMEQFGRAMSQRGHTIHTQPDESCWRIELPPSWDDYLAMLSKSHRKQINRLLRRYIDTGQVTTHWVQTFDQLDQVWPMFVELHQKRRRSLGQTGCFASKRFATFLREVAGQLLEHDGLRLVWLQAGGRAVSVEFQLSCGDTVYAYQSGIEPESLDLEPGRLLTAVAIRQAIDEGRRYYDFLRGNELYKAHWRATPDSCVRVRILRKTMLGTIRHRAYQARSLFRDWIEKRLMPASEAT